jgi:MazG family protein
MTDSLHSPPWELPVPFFPGWAPECLLPVSLLLSVVSQLRHPEQGCPWDLKQTHASLKPYLLEESYEALEAIDSGDPAKLREELGDVLLQVVLHAQLAKDAGQFDFNAVCQTLAEKLVRRHPHVFADVTDIEHPEQVTRQWQEIKAAEKGEKPSSKSILADISRSQPALSRAHRVSRKAVKAGFTWPDLDALWACVMSEFDELRQEVNADPETASKAERHDRLEDEMGDILFAVVSLAGHLGIDPEVALTRATDKFTRRFQRMEQRATQPLESLSFDAWDALWRAAKQQTP